MRGRALVVAYWAVNAPIALETLVGGVTDLIHGKTVLFAGPPVADVVTSLGYPVYVLSIIGFWKLLGGIVLLLPGFPRLKEWAYAGIFFELSGASASWVLYKHDFSGAAVPAFLALLTLLSWGLRPQNRVLGVLCPVRLAS